MYNQYLKNRVFSQTTTEKLTKHNSDGNIREVRVDDGERYHSAESLQSILVCTGVYNREISDETSERNHAPRDVITDPELKIPQHTCEHVLDAVKLVFHIEQFE